MVNLSKNLKLMTVKGFYPLRRALATVEINLKDADTDEPKLSICGNVWNSKHTDILMGGQCNEEFLRYILENHYSKLFLSRDTIIKLLDIWENHHLNDLTPECEHQRVLLSNIENKTYDNLITIPEFKKCSVCGYQYGSKWLYRPIPKEDLDFIKTLIV